MELFRGYVATKNKKCLQKFANGERLLTLEEAKELPEYAGILAHDTVLIDIDDEHQSEIMMDIIENLKIDCKVICTTRGRHFYFKNKNLKKCFTHAKLACGLTADIKIGLKNSYAILKFKGEERFCEWDSVDWEAPYRELPKWLMPINSSVDFLNMDDGDGRNQTLFNYIITLQKNGFEKEEVKDCLRLINKYILKSPLKDNELETIMRDEAFVDIQDDTDQFYTDKGAFLFDKFAKYLMENHKIVKINNQLHIFKDGIYKLGYEEIQAEMIKHISSLNKQKRTEVMSYLDLLIRDNTAPSDASYIAFKNGVYNIDTEEFTGFSNDLVITNIINHDYNPNAYSEIADNTLNKLACHDKQIRALLEEVIGYCFFRKQELRKAFILTGDKHNGKSTYLDMITTLLGSENTCALDLNEIGDRFKGSQLFGKLANIGDDIGDEFIANPAIFKKVVSGDRINAERKGQDPFDFACYAKMLFSANSIPRIRDKSGAVLDRLIIVPFDASFTKNDPDYDPFIKYKLREESVMEYLIKIGLEGLKRVLDRQSFTISDKVTKNIEEYEENNNPILLFFKENTEDDILNNQTKFVYQKYAEFCIGNSFQQLSNIEFSKQVKKFYDCSVTVKKIDGKSVRIFTR